MNFFLLQDLMSRLPGGQRHWRCCRLCAKKPFWLINSPHLWSHTIIAVLLLRRRSSIWLQRKGFLPDDVEKITHNQSQQKSVVYFDYIVHINKYTQRGR